MNTGAETNITTPSSLEETGSELRTFPPELPLRDLHSEGKEAKSIPDAVKKTWTENIVNQASMQLNITPEQIRDLVFHGATELRKTPIYLKDASIFRSCARWLLIYQRTWLSAKNDTDLKLLAVSWNELLHHGPQTGEQRNWFLDHATNSYQQFYEASRTDHNFKTARSLGGLMISSASTPREYIQAYKRMGRLFGAHIDRFDPSHKDWLPIVNTCIHYLNLAITQLGEHPEIEPVTSDKDLWEYCAWALDKRYDITFHDANIVKAIEYYEILIERSKHDIKEQLLWRDKLARAHWKRYTSLRSAQDGENGIAQFEKILEIEPSNPHALTGLAELIRQTAAAQVFSVAERRIITDRSIGLLERCIADTAEDNPHRANRLGKLSEAFVDRFHYDGDISDIDSAISLQISAIGTSSLPDGALAFHHQKLSDKYVLKYQQTKKGEDIEAALAEVKKCIELTPKGKIQAHIDAKIALASVYGAWYLSQHQIQHLQLAITQAEEASEMCDKTGWRSTPALGYLAKLYYHRFQRLKNYDDAAKGIKYVREVINLYRTAAGKNQLQREAELLSDLSKLMRARAEVYGAQEDLNEAVRAERDALKITDVEHKQYATRAADLSYNLTERFAVTKDSADLEEAANVLDVALQSIRVRRIPPTAQERALLENQYGIVCVRRGEKESNDAHIREAILHFQTAANEDPRNLPYSQNYASTIIDLAKKNMKLEEAIVALRAYQKYVEAIQRYAPETTEIRLPYVLKSLASLCISVMEKDQTATIFMPMAIKLLEQLQSAPLAPAIDRLWAAVERAKVAASKEKNFQVAGQFINIAAALLPTVLNPGLTRIDQLRLTKTNFDLPGYVLGFCILAGYPIIQAIQLFEQSRGVLWNRLLKEKDDLAPLHNVDQDLATQFRELHIRLSLPKKPIASLETDRSMAYNVTDSYSDAARYDALLSKIRDQPGFGDFLRMSTKLDELSSYATGGAIVIINCANEFSHAVIITSQHGATVLQLPDFSQTRAITLYNVMRTCLHHLKGDEEDLATKLFNEICTVLWSSVAKPVLDKLDELLLEVSVQLYKSKPVHRIWWVTNQWINVLPIHAAGIHFGSNPLDEPRTMLERSISSYIPSLGALKFARKNSELRRSIYNEQSNHKSSALVVSMPTTPGQIDLPNAVNESEAVSKIMTEDGVMVHQLAGSATSRKAIVSSLQSISVAHVICHGLVDPGDPLKSQLLLSDSHRSPLDVRTLIQASMPLCTLVYLSVCNAATSEVIPLVDEGLHVAGAFLMAGVPHVIGTRWELADQLAITVARGFYGQLASCETNKSDKQDSKTTGVINVSHSPEILRDVLLTVRDEKMPAILYSSYVHYGV